MSDSSEWRPKYLPRLPIHPGRLLSESVEFRGLSVADLSRQVGCSVQELSEILAERAEMTDEIAARLQDTDDWPTDYWPRLLLGYRLTCERDREREQRESALREAD